MDRMQKKREDLDALNTELLAFQEKMGGADPPSQTEADAMDKKADEALALQKELDEYVGRVEKLQKTLNWKPADLSLPPDDQPDVVDNVIKDSQIAGFMRIGEYVIAMGQLQKWQEAGRPKHAFNLADVPTLIRAKGEREPMVPLDRKQIAAIMQTKAIPTIGANVIEPTRLPELVRATEHDRLRLRDILNISQTDSNAVEWVRLVNYTRAADPTAHGALKPESDLQLETASSTVRTVAVSMPVQDQQLDDLPALQNLINVELLYDLEKRLEELVCWGDGLGINFLGFFADPLIWACGQMTLAGATRVVAGDTTIDIIRRGITDVRVAGYEPNGILLHPYDWEDVVLLKSTTNNYVWVVVTEGAISRMWGVPVIETVACEDFQGHEIEARNLLVGDFTRGSTLWDRMQSQISVGWIDDQFRRNMRTILAEFRAAWAIRRPGAFRDYQTQAAVES